MTVRDKAFWQRFWDNAFATPGTLDINSLDSLDPHAASDMLDHDKLDAKRDNELIETNTATEEPL